ncbi:hypothetical protein RchiOBHm_Chr5g0005901 [Rosa chinensis]|uniref:Uncharacterized protein n=1 Tax=Rosa chinensis TaxID=74649 RepID=A0A2P6Q3F5_ROSCH|nr:uncharacterized protein LOC112201807 [Rosa chinensis]PRQ28706.1 hypothetical protein RchiOBHm_Chr5g0005901 [Rosa chinensis]
MGRRTIIRIRKILRVPHIITIPKIVTVEKSPDSSTIFSSLTGFSSLMAVYASLLSISDDPKDPLSDLETEAKLHLRAIHREEAEDADSRRWFAQLRSRSDPPWWRLCKSLLWKTSLRLRQMIQIQSFMVAYTFALEGKC